jgi:DNA-binding MarR family transcriptional regulator
MTARWYDRKDLGTGLILAGLLALAGYLWRPARVAAAAAGHWLADDVTLPRWSIFIAAILLAVLLILWVARVLRDLPDDGDAMMQVPPIPTLDPPLTEVQWELLLVLSMGVGTLSLEQLAQRVKANPHRVLDALKQLAARGLVDSYSPYLSGGGDRYELAGAGRKLLLNVGAI